MRNNENNENVLTLRCSDIFNCFDVYSRRSFTLLRYYEYYAFEIFS